MTRGGTPTSIDDDLGLVSHALLGQETAAM